MTFCYAKSLHVFLAFRWLINMKYQYPQSKAACDAWRLGFDISALNGNKTEKIYKNKSGGLLNNHGYVKHGSRVCETPAQAPPLQSATKKI